MYWHWPSSFIMVWNFCWILYSFIEQRQQQQNKKMVQSKFLLYNIIVDTNQSRPGWKSFNHFHNHNLIGLFISWDLSFYILSPPTNYTFLSFDSIQFWNDEVAIKLNDLVCKTIHTNIINSIEMWSEYYEFGVECKYFEMFPIFQCPR